VDSLEVVKKALTRFLIKLVFCILLMLSLYFIGFLPTFWILAGIFLFITFFTKVVKLELLEKLLLKFERQYEKGFSGKETLTILLGFIFFFIILWILHFFLVFSIVDVALLGLCPLAFGHNLIKPVQALFRNHVHFITGKLSVEGFVVAVLVNILVLYILFPYSIVVLIYVALIAGLFDLLPHIDSNYTIPIFTALAFLLFFI
jgi:dolichol kinase